MRVQFYGLNTSTGEAERVGEVALEGGALRADPALTWVLAEPCLDRAAGDWVLPGSHRWMELLSEQYCGSYFWAAVS